MEAKVCVSDSIAKISSWMSVRFHIRTLQHSLEWEERGKVQKSDEDYFQQIDFQAARIYTLKWTNKFESSSHTLSTFSTLHISSFVPALDDPISNSILSRITYNSLNYLLSTQQTTSFTQPNFPFPRHHHHHDPRSRIMRLSL